MKPAASLTELLHRAQDGDADAVDSLFAATYDGEGIYIDSVAEIVIVRFASHPLAANSNYDSTSLPAYDAVARHLLR